VYSCTPLALSIIRVDGEPFDGDNNVGDDFDLEGMDLDHDDDYDETM
jgi:hypothetical protein